MVGLLLLTLGMAGQAQELKPPALPEPVPTLEVLMKREGPRGGSGWAGESGLDPFESYITVTASETGCGLGAYNVRPSNFAGSMWRITGETLRRNGDVLSVKVTWQRFGENGRLVNNEHPELVQQLTLKAGERFVLEPMASTSERCGDANLEASVVMRRPPIARSGGGGGGGLFSGTGGAGRVQGINSSEMLRLRKEAQSVASPAPLSAVAGPPVDLELWLIDKRADGSEHAVRQLVRAGGDSNGAFKFTSVIADLSSGRSTVQIAGEIQSIFGGRPNTVRVRVERRVTAPGTGGAAGTSMVQVVLANASDVIAIELPERGRTSGGPLIPGHDFSLRLRLAPASDATTTNRD